MENKKIILIMIYIFTFLIIRAQNDTVRVLPKDSSAINNQIKNNVLDFLIGDTLYYDFYIERFFKIKDGYLIALTTEIDGLPIYAVVITAKEKMINMQKIKKGNILPMKLMRYFEPPLNASIENPPVYDIMLGNKTMNILSTGAFNYLFITHNLKGLYYIDSNIVEKEKKEIEKKKGSIDSIVCDFIQSITFDIDTIYTINYVDTSKLKKSLRKYSFLAGPSFYNSWTPPSKMPYLEWSNLGINKHNFNSLFWGMLKWDYRLPKKKSDYSDFYLSYRNIISELLYYSKNIYTVRVKWKLPRMENSYTAVLSIQEKNGEYKIIGFNRAMNVYYE